MGDDCFEHLGDAFCTCGPGAVGSCRAYVEQVDADEYAAVCALGRSSARDEIVCGGDL